MKKIKNKLLIGLLTGVILTKSDIYAYQDNYKVIETSDQKDKSDIEDIDEQIITEFTNIEEEIDNLLESENIKKVKKEITNKFIMIVDFIFYDTEINGVKYSELKDETKIIILDKLNIIDEKIEEKIPNYKDTCKEKYQITKKIVKEKYEEISKKLKEELKNKIGEENYNEYSESFKDIKEATGEIVDTTKKVGDKAKIKIKKWYEGLK